MNRKNFIGSFLGLVGVVSSAKELASLKTNTPIIDKPGISNEGFKLILHKDWVLPGDVLSSTSFPNKLYRFTGENLIEMTNTGRGETIEVELTTNVVDERVKSQPEFAKVMGVWLEGGEKPETRPLSFSNRKIIEYV